MLFLMYGHCFSNSSFRYQMSASFLGLDNYIELFGQIVLTWCNLSVMQDTCPKAKGGKKPNPVASILFTLMLFTVESWKWCFKNHNLKRPIALSKLVTPESSIQKSRLKEPLFWLKDNLKMNKKWNCSAVFLNVLVSLYLVKLSNNVKTVSEKFPD